MATSRNADVIKNKFKSGVSPPLFLFRCVECINLGFWTAVQKLRLIPSTQRRGKRGGEGKGDGKTLLLNLFFMMSAFRLAAILDGPKLGHYYY